MTLVLDQRLIDKMLTGGFYIHYENPPQTPQHRPLVPIQSK